MKNLFTTILSTFVATDAIAGPYTQEAYKSSLLTFIFLGFCALIVIAQLMPAIMTFVGMLKGVKPVEKVVEQ